jgi:EAL domain-containing protein (putative c-di-GMP-specific phosphodiesterase class I)
MYWMSKTSDEHACVKSFQYLALESNSLYLVFMPMFDCQTLEIMGIEVLVRSNHPSLYGIGPDRFIPVAENTALIKELDLWVIDKSQCTIKELQSTHGFKGIICINTSGVELHNEGFPERVRRLLDKHQIDPSTIELEITETSLVLDDKKGVLILHQLKELGITLSLDDYGTGYTAFSQLINYPVDCLKIDKSFVGGLFSENEARNKIVRIIQNLAEIYDLRVVAEGVETQAQMDYLRDNGCDWAQGHLLSQSITKNSIIELLENSTNSLTAPAEVIAK